MQQSKALYLNNFFKTINFILQKQKMLEITSNIKISLDLFELATFGTNYGLETAGKTITGCMKVSLQYFSPLTAKHSLKMICTLVSFSDNLTLHNAPGAKV